MTISANFPNVQPSLLLDFANAKQLPPQVAFTRATSATYYDGSTTAKAEQNLVTYSQEFDNAAWVKTSATVTANSTAAPDGTTTADTLTASAATSSHLLQRLVTTIASEPQGYSIYAKYSTAQYIAFGFTSGGLGSAWAYVTVDIQNGTITQTTNGGGAGITISGSITSVGSGWYRISVLGNYTQTNTYPTILIVDTGTPSFTAFGNYAWTATGTEAVFIWGAQMEQRTAVTAYTATTTQAITNYVPVLLTAGGGQPRFDHNPTTSESLGLLIEEQRTNLLLYSSQLDTNPWTINASTVTITSNTVIAPDGTLTGDLLKSNSATNDFIYQIPTLAISTVATFSFYIKNIDAVISRVMSRNSVTSMEVVINWSGATLTSLTINTATSASFAAVGNGWYRVQVTYTTGETNQQVRIYPDSGNTGKSVFVWGTQLEAASFATSYIATTSAAATRAADSAVMTGNNFTSWFNNSEGTLYVEASPQTQSSNSFGMASLTNAGNSNNSIAMYYTGGNVVDVESLVNAVAQYTYLIPRGAQPTKVAHGYKVNNSNVALNGTAYTADTVCLVPPVSTLTIGTIYDATSYPCNGTVRKLAYYPIRVTDAQLAALTS